MREGRARDISKPQGEETAVRDSEEKKGRRSSVRYLRERMVDWSRSD